jgi:glycosyltransferase involved in cell wall biosynthesis
MMMLKVKLYLRKIAYFLLGILGYFKHYSNKSCRRNVYIIGDLYSESGLGNVTRSLIASFDQNIDFKLINLPLSIESKQGEYSFQKREAKKLGDGICIFVGNPSILLQAFLKLNPYYLFANYTIGVWFWELEKIPANWERVEKLVNEVWAQSEFSARVFRKSSSIVKVMPFSLPYQVKHKFKREYFSLPEKQFVFLMTFDYLSHVARKNPSAVIQAFLEEFGSDQSVTLVIKSVNQNLPVINKNLLPSKARENKNIKFIDDYLTKDEMLSLIEVVDCYVSLHRSEGLGLGLAEAMSLGTLVIGTKYSGNMQFMNQKNSLLVDYTLVPVKVDEYPYADGNVWAEPKISSARAQMRYAVTHQVECQLLVLQGKIDLEQYDLSNQISWLKRNLG